MPPSIRFPHQSIVLTSAIVIGLGAAAYFYLKQPGKHDMSPFARPNVPSVAADASTAVERTYDAPSLDRVESPATEQAGAVAKADSRKVLYTCPMESHADVVSDHPGACPKCGMMLMPTSQVQHGARAESTWQTQANAPGVGGNLGVARLLRDHTGWLRVNVSTAPTAQETCGSCGMTAAEMAAGVDCSHGP